jgi:putative YD repeat protein
MKSYFNIILFFCACFSLSAQEKDEGKYTEEQLEVFGGTLQGHVKSVERIYYIGEESEGVDKKRLPNDNESNSTNEHCKYSFDREGNITEIQIFDTLSSVKYKQIFTYNNLWLPSHIESFQYQDKKEVAHYLETYTYKGKEVILKEVDLKLDFDKKKRYVFKEITNFNQQNQKESISEYSGNKLQAKTTFTYDVKGNLTKEEYKKLSSKEEGKTTYYTYDDKGQLLTKERIALGTVHYFDTFGYLSNGKVWQKTSYEIYSEEKDKKRNETITYYTYDANGDLVEDQYIGMDDFKVGTSYCYENKKLKENYTYVQGALKSVTFWREENGKTTKQEEFSPEGKLQGGVYYTYDDKGNCTMELYKSFNERTRTIETTGKTIYKYDIYNNCTYEAKFFRDSLEYLIERNFTYYE